MELLDYEKRHLETVRQGLAECTVLLKSNGAFPLAKPGKLALYGSGARHTVKGGTGSGEVNSRYFINVCDGLTTAGFRITTGPWLDAYEDERRRAKATARRRGKAEAKANRMNPIIAMMGSVVLEPEYRLPLVRDDSDTAVYVLSRISGEGNDRKPERGDIKLTETEERTILALDKKYKHFMLVLNTGGPVDLSAVRGVGNILVLSQLGVETGSVLADILLGKVNPSGKLATTWSAWEDYCDVGDFGDLDETRYREGVYVGYRFFDSVGKQAIYPFGFGLSYTTFRADDFAASVEGSRVTVQGMVTNTGNRPGKEVVQLYVSPPAGKLDKPWQSLAAFAKTDVLAPGDGRTISMGFDLRDLASYDPECAAYVLEAGIYLLRAGTSSVDTHLCGAVSLSREVTVRQVKNLLGDPAFTDWKPETARAREALDDSIPVLTVDPDAISTETAAYDRSWDIAPEIAALPDDALTRLSCGHFADKGGIASVIGSASAQVAGAAGETAHVNGVPVLVMADGPAGLRLSRDYFIDKNGNKQGLGAALPETMADALPKPVSALMGLLTPKPPKGQEVLHQYCTAIPIGTAIAQSWNLEYARQCGDLVGEEMERFGVHLWLAPALNIHRDIRCGRNFEYFSEDPLVSGLFAAAITQGVQRHPGCGVTIKHFCANNQELNRYGNNSRVSERALREIYLKGFELCVREAQPCALMTSYNLLNGTHTSMSRALAEDILRCEWGYEGIVMTDWVVGGDLMLPKNSRYGVPEPWAVAAAGGDLFMPGSKADADNIMEALQGGKLSRKQLQINGTRVFRLAQRLVGAEG